MKYPPKVYIEQLKLYRSGFEGNATVGFFYPSEKENVQWQDILSLEEIRYWNKLTPAKKRSFIHGRYIAKQCLQENLPEFGLKELSISNGIFGQPLLSFETGLHLSISHSGNASVSLIFPRVHPMGIDIQQINTGNNNAIGSQLTSAEIKLLEGENFFTHLWTVKEALSKILQTGLLVSFPVLEVQKTNACEGYQVSYFKNFAQYKAVSFQWQQHICAIVLPANTHLNIHLLLENLTADLELPV